MKTLAKVALVFIVFACLAVSLLAVGLTTLFAQVEPHVVVSAPAIQTVADIPELAALDELSALSNLETISIHKSIARYGPEIFPLQTGPDDKLVLGGVFTLAEDEVLRGSLMVMGGTAILEEGSRVEGDVVLLGGSVSGHGAIEGDVIAIGGFIELSESAHVRGNVNAIGGHVAFADRSSIEGDVFNGLEGDFPFVIPGDFQIPEIPQIPQVPQVNVNTGPNYFMKFLWWLFRSFLWAALAVLLVLFVPGQTRRVARVTTSQTLIALAIGLFTAVAVPLLLFFIAITIIGIPVSLVGGFFLAAAWAFGVVAIGTETGNRLASAFRQEWALPVAAGLGALIFTLVVNGLGALVPCVGWMAPVFASMVGLGAVVLTRFGTQEYPPDANPPDANPPVVPAGPAISAPQAPTAPSEVPAPLESPVTVLVDEDEELPESLAKEDEVETDSPAEDKTTEPPVEDQKDDSEPS